MQWPSSRRAMRSSQLRKTKANSPPIFSGKGMLSQVGTYPVTTSILGYDLYAAATLELDRANPRGRIDLETRQWVE
jgi:hypothetical protein